MKLLVLGSVLSLSLLIANNAFAAGNQPLHCDTQCMAKLRELQGLLIQLDRQQKAQAAKRHTPRAKIAQPKRKAAKPYQRAKAHPRKPKAVAKHARSNGRLTYSQQLMLLQQQQMLHNNFMSMYRNTARNQDFQMRVFSARQACMIAGNCRVEVRPY